MSATSTVENVYEFDIDFYDEFKYEMEHYSMMDLICLSREMIYYNHLTNEIMFEFLRTNEDLYSIIERIKIKSLDEYMQTGMLF